MAPYRPVISIVTSGSTEFGRDTNEALNCNGKEIQMLKAGAIILSIGTGLQK
jgi:hypothetical protein